MCCDALTAYCLFAVGARCILRFAVFAARSSTFVAFVVACCVSFASTNVVAFVGVVYGVVSCWFVHAVVVCCLVVRVVSYGSRFAAS